MNMHLWAIHSVIQLLLTGVMTTSNMRVLGGTGRTGGRIVQRLHDRRIQACVASRRANALFLWNDSSTSDAAFDGSSAAYVCYSPSTAGEFVADVALGRSATDSTDDVCRTAASGICNRQTESLS